MSAKHFVLWTQGTRTHLASRNAYRNGTYTWLFDEQGTVPDQLVQALGWWDWQTPINGPFPAFAAERVHEIVAWLRANGYTARLLDEETPS